MELSWFSVIIILVEKVSCRGDECPPWFTLDYSNDSLFPQCVCSQAMSSFITCNQREKTSYIKVGHCAFLDEVINDTVVTWCPYVFPQHLIHNGLIRLPQNTTYLNTFMCGHLTRHLGSPLCGRCTNGTGPSIYSFGSQCVSCSVLNVLYYLLLQYAPVTIIFLGIMLLRITLVSPPMAHYVMYCNIVHVLLKLLGLKIFTDTFYGSHKDGTDGTWDFRPAAGILFLIWMIQAVGYEILYLTVNNTAFPLKIYFALLVAVLGILCVVCQPYKHRAANTSGTLLLIILIIIAGLYNIVDTYEFSTEKVLMCIAVATLPHCVFYGYGIYLLAKGLKQCTTTANGDYVEF